MGINPHPRNAVAIHQRLREVGQSCVLLCGPRLSWRAVGLNADAIAVVEASGTLARVPGSVRYGVHKLSYLSFMADQVVRGHVRRSEEEVRLILEGRPLMAVGRMDDNGARRIARSEVIPVIDAVGRRFIIGGCVDVHVMTPSEPALRPASAAAIQAPRRACDCPRRIPYVRCGMS